MILTKFQEYFRAPLPTTAEYDMTLCFYVTKLDLSLMKEEDVLKLLLGTILNKAMTKCKKENYLKYPETGTECRLIGQPQPC